MNYLCIVEDFVRMKSGLRDTSIAVKVGRLHIPLEGVTSIYASPVAVIL